MSHLFHSLLAHTAPQSLLGSADASAVSIGSIFIFFIVVAVIIFTLFLLMLAGFWKICVKAGKKGWISLIPIYNRVVLLEIVGRPLWWIVLLFIPVVNIFVYITLIRRLASQFGKGTGFTVGMIFLPFIFLPILGFGTATYSNHFPPSPPASDAVKWTLAGALVCFILYLPFLLGFSSAFNSGRSELTILTAPDAPSGAGDSGYVTDGVEVYFLDRPIRGADAKKIGRAHV